MHVASPILILHIRPLKHFPSFSHTKWQGLRFHVFLQLLFTCSHSWTFMVYHAAMKALAFCSPVIYFPSFTSRFVRHSFPYSALYRSLVLRHPTLLSLGMTGAEATKFQEQAATDSYGVSTTEQVPKWNCPWAQVEIGESRKRTLEGLNKQNAKCSKETTVKIYAELGAQLVSKNSTNFRQTDH